MSTKKTKFSQEDSDLVAELHALHKRQPKLVRSSTYFAPAVPEMMIESWKMNEFKYYVVPSPFPTLARGLFTTKVSKESGKDRYRIVARGYDKFFNIGEVPWTTWGSLESHTKPPYTLTLKSNGCIIFIAALTAEKLLVASKHSLGRIQGVPESHAQAGERWLKHHLEAAGKTPEQLAEVLYEKNWTAVAELCDDEFEEHVLPYSRDKSGLHLHGLNESTCHFKTMLPSVVDAFAQEWGFIVTPSTSLRTISEVRAFTEEISQTGKWRGEALEGFVVRTTVSEPPTDGKHAGSASPYTPGSSFFFKVKFDEPYMMYRDWREITKILLSPKGGLDEAKLPRNKMRRPETKLYVQWIKKEIRRDKAQFEGYSKGKGIIRTRERFLEWLETKDGKKQKEENEKDEGVLGADEGKRFGKTIIVPVAIPGVGKTSVAVALTHLFGFGHTQSDDVTAKKAAPAFIKNVKDLLKTHDVVIADKNNHLRQHRQQLRDAVKGADPPVRLVALNWALDRPLSTIHRICGDRVLGRGMNHQSLYGDSKTKAHENVIWMFLNQAEELADGEVDACIDMDIAEPLEDMVDRAVEGCVRVLGLPKPDREKVGEALGVARGYAPSIRVKGKAKEKAKEKVGKPRYFGILAEVDLEGTLGPRLTADDVPQKVKEFWEHLKMEDRIASRPHITIVHSKNLPAEIGLWDRCMALHQLAEPPLFRFKLGRVLVNGRVAAAVVEDVQFEDAERDEGQEGGQFVGMLGEEVRERLHVTVGTRDGSVPPVEGMEMVRAWRRGLREGVEEVGLEGVVVKGRVKGLMS